MKTENIKFEVTLKSLFVITLFILLIVLVWQLRLVFVLLFLAFIINSSLRPYVDFFETKRIPRFLSTALMYVTLFLILSLMMVTIFSETIEQMKNLFLLMPQLLTNILEELFLVFPWLQDLIDLQDLRNRFVADFSSLGGVFNSGLSSAYTILNSAISTVGGLVTITMLSIYMLVRKEEVYNSFINFLPIKKADKIKYAKRLEKVEIKLGAWMRAQLFLMVFIGVLTWIGLVTPSAFFEEYKMHEYALPIAFIASILEAVPNIGPFVTAIFAIIIAVGSGSSLSTVLYIILLFLAIQQLEGIFIVPKIMQRVIGIDPIITIISVIGAYILFGIVGAIFIIPLIAVMQIMLGGELNEMNRRNELEV